MLNTSSTEPIRWADMFKIWRDFCQAPELPFCDRWLKQIFKTQFPIVRVSLPEQLQLTHAFNQAIINLALASYLQSAFEKGVTEFTPESAIEFDANFNPLMAKKIPHQDFWYWVSLRAELDVSDYQVRQQKDRDVFFTKFKAVAEQDPTSPLGLLWYGLRPCFDVALKERAHVSHWSAGELKTFIKSQVEPLPLWLRHATNESPEAIAKELIQEGVNARVEAGVICAEGGRGVTQTRAYRMGQVEIQDLSSQQIAASVAVKSGQKVWDACAGAGGKTLAIAANMNNKGSLIATDLYDYKLLELKRRAKRAEVFNLRTFTWDARAPLRLPKEVAKQQGFDWILVDAPCSSSGTWRRNPDARWRLEHDEVNELIALQRQIVRQALPALRKGGHFVYATCSWQVAENEEQVRWMLENFSELSLVSQTLLGSPTSRSDTMFVAVLSASDAS